jgi:prevent-host-death family protein
MTTKLIGIRDFRQNISDYVAKARKKKARYIVTYRNIPMFEIVPFKKEYTQEFYDSIMAGLDDIKNGRVYSHEEVIKKLSLDDKK